MSSDSKNKAAVDKTEVVARVSISDLPNGFVLNHERLGISLSALWRYVQLFSNKKTRYNSKMANITVT